MPMLDARFMIPLMLSGFFYLLGFWGNHVGSQVPPRAYVGNKIARMFGGINGYVDINSFAVQIGLLSLPLLDVLLRWLSIRVGFAVSMFLAGIVTVIMQEILKRMSG
jgi:hypothetical protein